MANEWKWKRGPGLTVQALAAGAHSKGQPCYLSSNEATACGDGNSVDLVAATDVSSGAMGTYYMPFNDVFEVKTGADLGMFARVYMGASNVVDAGSAGNIACGVVVDYNPASSGCALIAVQSALSWPTTHA